MISTEMDDLSADALGGEVFFGKTDGVLFLRLVGSVRYTNCSALDDFVEALFSEYEFDRLVIDLRQVESIDSTNLGILVKIAQYAKRDQLPQPSLICDAPDIQTVIASMGIDEVYHLCAKNESGSRCKVFTKVENAINNCSLNVKRVMLDAHEKLSEMNQSNHDAFREVLGALKGDL